MPSSIAAPSQPRKRLFILLLGAASGRILGLFFLPRWLPSVDLLKGRPRLPLVGKLNERPAELRINPCIKLTAVKKNWQTFCCSPDPSGGTVALKQLASKA